jgi:hypothetical protein
MTTGKIKDKLEVTSWGQHMEDSKEISDTHAGGELEEEYRRTENALLQMFQMKLCSHPPPQRF